ncbi:hypothetical protein L484_001729 [Morus notabilis]|uniref:Uncharacterized protein n=1 Tax=Morus notabilis TaxID=981085 RepID=W9R8W0_9ROSA|nr:uncharacterized protein LOC21385321 [Morus notabilis]EXB63111.1 hypothetical protein L484_001729 [Morus notabilis]
MKTKAKSQNRFLRIITIPLRGLIKARDMYVRGMNNMEVMSRTNTVKGSAGRLSSGLPKSFSVATARKNDSDDYAELVRAASARDYGGKFDLDMLLQQQLRQVLEETTTTGAEGLPKCSSVGMGKIDEDKPYEFSDDKKADFLYPRSTSYAVFKRSTAVI